jgi:hypothetical protein
MKQTRWDIVALVSITLTGLACHLTWERLPSPVVFASTALVTVALGGWTAWLWPRVALWLTKFFCIAAIFDLAAEGVLRPYHGDTATAKLICQMTLFAAYAIYLGALRPLDVWLASPARRGSLAASASEF